MKFFRKTGSEATPQASSFKAVVRCIKEHSCKDSAMRKYPNVISVVQLVVDGAGSGVSSLQPWQEIGAAAARSLRRERLQLLGKSSHMAL